LRFWALPFIFRPSLPIAGGQDGHRRWARRSLP
jgi:hypothetical protein